MIKAKEQFEIKEVGTIHTKEEPKCINIRSSSKNKPIKDYHTLSEKYRVLNETKNVAFGVVVAVVLLANGWIELDSKALQILVAVLIAGFAALSIRALDEALMEE
jgi:hypothetical protein|uniref:Uncharacterized protein n=1 Tax=Siphoviridae sp. ct6bb17 TaxID=2825345 RepID=A0A8S5NZ07_9CAUD|nr:MAG TPA: hypothetical protein [Siphoviridae sp. ct6bb17]